MKILVVLALSLGMTGAAYAGFSGAEQFEIRKGQEAVVTGGNVAVTGGQAVALDTGYLLKCERVHCTVIVLAFMAKGQNACFDLYALVDNVQLGPDIPQCGFTGTAFQSAFDIPKGVHTFQSMIKLNDGAPADTVSAFQITYTVYAHGRG
ncbi:MAG TPA: hypothetical protein VMF67_11375 [Rhizomicrobium sp.]|nr:hypothetical protein [Rhizomicrobium sp.]